MAFGLENYIANQYLRALAVVVLVFVVLRLLVFIIEKIILKATSKTKTDIDDIFVKKVTKPVSMIILLIGFRIAIEELGLAETVEVVIANILWSCVVVALGFVVFYFVDIVLVVGIKKTLKHAADSEVVDSLMSLMHSILKVILVVLVFIYILDIWGIEIGPFLAGLGIAGIAIAFAMQESLSNIFAGISMILDKSVKVGDLIYLDADTRGKVLHVGLRSTKMISFDNELMIMPNSKVANGRIQNIGEPDPKARVVIPFGVVYGSNIDKVKRIVVNEIKKVKNFINEPEPSVKFLEMGSSSLNFKAYFYVDSFEHRFGAIDEANTKIYNALNRAGIEIPYPQMDLHFKSDFTKKRKG
jgi:MscS family membrane protein